MKRLLGLIVLFICMQLALAVNSAAYLDPSAMTYLIQAVAGVVIAGGAAIVIYWKKIKLFFKKKKRKAAVQAAQAVSEQNKPSAQSIQTSDAAQQEKPKAQEEQVPEESHSPAEEA